MLPLPDPNGSEGLRLVEPVLHWVVRGRVDILIDGTMHRVDSGSALWVPAGADIRVVLRRRDVVVPVPGLRLGAATRAQRVEIPASWQLWLLHVFGEGLGYLDGDSCRPLLQTLLDAAVPIGPVVGDPPSPRSEELIALAASIASAPAIPIAEQVRRRLPGWSSRTLQRRFRAETGLSPEQWARQRRMVAAAELLAAGHSVESVAPAVGYATVSGFSRSFRERTGVSPGRWSDATGTRIAAARPADAPSAARLPARRTWARVNGSHVAVWVVRGSASLQIADRIIALPQGSAVVLPAGLPNAVRIPEGALVLPVGFRSGRSGRIGAPAEPAWIPPEEETDLLQGIVAAYTGIRPPGLDAFSGFDGVLSRSVHRAATDDDEVIATLASAMATGDLADTSLAGCARWAGCTERELSRIINERTGATFAQWMRASRMSRARAQLHGGSPASTVSRGLGYAHLPAFSRAFREVHGTSPQGIVTLAAAGEARRWHAEVARLAHMQTRRLPH